MNDLATIVASKEMSVRLVEAGVVIDTALVWVGINLWGREEWGVAVRTSVEVTRANPKADRMENGATLEERGYVIVPAPTLSELKSYVAPDDNATTEWWADVALKVKGKVKP